MGTKWLFTENQEKEICKQYFKNRLSTYQIAKRFQCGSTTIRKIIYSHDLKPRTQLEGKSERRGELSSSWKGGKIIDTHGYVLIHKPKHPRCNCRGYVFEHRLLMEKHLGRYLRPKEVVHHINEIRDDNKIQNLKLFVGVAEHLHWHKIKRRLFTDSQEMEICDLYFKDKISQQKIAKQKECSRTTIGNITKRRGNT